MMKLPMTPGPHFQTTQRSAAEAGDAVTARAALVREVIQRRRSTRRFRSEPIPQGDLLELVEAGIHAPSGSNWQNQRFLIVSDKEEINRIGRIRYVWPYKTRGKAKLEARRRNPAGILGHATALIFVFADAAENYRGEGGEYYIWESLETQNCAAAIQNILLLAAAKGIGSCWVSASEAMSYSRLLSGKSWNAALAPYEVPASYKVQGIVVLGYPHAADERGYPRGEKKHGATIWAEVARKPVEHYLVAARDTMPARWRKLSLLRRLRRRCGTWLIGGLLRLVRRLDVMVTRIDLEELRRNGSTDL